MKFPFEPIASHLLLRKVAFTAWAQRRDAKLLTPKMQPWQRTTSLGKEANTADMERADGNRVNNSRIHPWTDIHSFYALMGGFAFSTRDLPPEKKFLPGNRDVVILQIDGIEFLAEHEPSLIPDLSKRKSLTRARPADSTRP